MPPPKRATIGFKAASHEWVGAASAPVSTSGPRANLRDPDAKVVAFLRALVPFTGVT